MPNGQFGISDSKISARRNGDHKVAGVRRCVEMCDVVRQL
jgi:hypothetical protein